MLKHPPRADKIHTKHRKHSKIPGLSYPWFSTSMEWVRFAKKKKKRKISKNFGAVRIQLLGEEVWTEFSQNPAEFSRNSLNLLPHSTREGEKKFPPPSPALPTFPQQSRNSSGMEFGCQEISSVHCLTPQFRKSSLDSTIPTRTHKTQQGSKGNNPKKIKTNPKLHQGRFSRQKIFTSS